MARRRQRLKAEGTFLDMVSSRLKMLEQLVVELHWLNVCQICFDQSAFWIENGGRQVEQAAVIADQEILRQALVGHCVLEDDPGHALVRLQVLHQEKCRPISCWTSDI